MKANVGMIDKTARILIGVILIALALTGVIGPWGWIGVLPILTAVVGICPLYSLLRINTCSKET